MVTPTVGFLNVVDQIVIAFSETQLFRGCKLFFPFCTLFTAATGRSNFFSWKQSRRFADIRITAVNS